jgi:putative transcriptional regulator
VGKVINRVGELLEAKERATGKKMTLEAFALETNLAYATVAKWKKNQVDRFDATTLAVLCEYFHCQPGDILVYVETGS